MTEQECNPEPDTLIAPQLQAGIDPQNLYQPPYQQQTEPVSKVIRNAPKYGGLTGSNGVYGAVYSGVPVYEMMCRNVAVMRRQKDSFLNATQILKVAQIEKGKRTKILEREIQNRDHEKVQGGYGKYQGTWIPFERGQELARHYKMDHLLRPLLEYVPPLGRSDKTPTKEQVLGTQPKGGKKNIHLDKKMRLIEPINDAVVEGLGRDIQYSSDVNLCDQFFDFNESKNYYDSYGYYPDPYAQPSYHRVQPPQNSQSLSIAEPSSERHRATIMALFMNSGMNSGIDMLLPQSILPPDFDIDLILDDQGHTASHWAAALANINLLSLLVQKGAQVQRLNFLGETSLIRAVVVSHNHEHQSFVDLLNVLKDTICIADKKNRTVLHHICLSSTIKAKNQTSVYYMQCILEYIAKTAYDEAISAQLVHSDSQLSLARYFSDLLNAVDICGDTAVNIASRLGNHQLFEQLIEAGADPNIPNYSGVRPYDFGFEAPKTIHGRNIHEIQSPNMCIVYPGIQTEQETSSQTIVNSPQLFGKPLSDELQEQLAEMTQQITQYRKEIGPLRDENMIIPGLNSRIQELENLLLDNHSDYKNDPSKLIAQNGVNYPDEISRLKLALVNQKAVEFKLCEELVALRGTLGHHEISCKKIISACCSVSLSQVDEILQPLLDALESDDFDHDMRLVTDVMTKIRSENQIDGDN